MFSYCKRSVNTKNSKFPHAYHMNSIQTQKGFGKDPTLCDNIQMPFVHHRGTPRDLLDLEAKIKGQDYKVQPFCANPSVEDTENDLQFSTFGWLQGQPIPRGPAPCAPTPIIEVKTYGGSSCDHVGGVRPCGQACGCSPRCQCKEMWRDRNMQRPAVGVLGFSQVPGCKFTF